MNKVGREFFKREIRRKSRETRGKLKLSANCVLKRKEAAKPDVQEEA